MEEIQMAPRSTFYNEILAHYTNKAQNCIPQSLLEELAQVVTEKLYSEYLKFRVQYPKSVKRYSMLKHEDIEHPYTLEEVVKFFKRNDRENYIPFACAALGFTKEELQSFEKKHKEFWEMF